MKTLLSFLLTLVLCTSCYENFEDGADLSFYTIRGRLAGDWYLRGVWINGIDSSAYTPYKELLGNLKFSYERKHSSDVFYVNIKDQDYIEFGTIHYFGGEPNKTQSIFGEFNYSKLKNNVGQIDFGPMNIELLTCRKNRLVWESRERRRSSQARFPNTRVKLLFLRK